MIELKDGMDFHNFMLDLQPKEWFKRQDKELIGTWLDRISYNGSKSFDKLKWRKANRYWLDASFDICLAVLSFLRQNNMEKETLEQLVGFELDLSGSYDFKISELKKLELYTNIELWKTLKK
jgi:hypothetical protein